MQTQAEFVKLDWDDDRDLRYTTEDNHIGHTSVKQTIQCLQFTNMFFDAASCLNDIKDKLAIWTYQNKEKIEKAFLTIRNNGFLFLVITKSKSFDEDFEDKLSDLDISIAVSHETDLPINTSLSVQALPNCSENQYKAFLSHDMTFECRVKNADNK